MKNILRLSINWILKKNDFIINSYFYILVSFFIVIRLLFVFSCNIGYQAGEEDNIWNVLRVINGKELYTTPESLPFEVYLYSPISQWINIFVVKSLKISNIYTISIVLRGLSLLYNLITIYIIHKTIKYNFLNISKNNRFWLIGIAFITLIHLNWTIRVDSLSILLMTLTLYFFLKNLDELNLKNEFLISLSLSLSIFTKQDGIQLLILIPFTLIFIKNYKKAFRIIFFSSTIISIFLLLLHKNYGQTLFLSIIGGLNSPKSITTTLNVAFRYIQLYNVLTFFIFFNILWGLSQYKNKLVLCLTLLSLGTFGFAIVTSMKLGAWVNYFTIFNLIGVLLIASYIDKNKKNIFSNKIIIVLFLTYFTGNLIFNYIFPEFKFNINDLNVIEKESYLIRNLIPKNSIVYTNMDQMELFLYDITIFPNQVFYSGIGKFKYDLTEINYNSFYYIGKENDLEKDFILNNMLGLNKNNFFEIKTFKNYSLFKIEK